jgi:hypothetical protein
MRLSIISSALLIVISGEGLSQGTAKKFSDSEETWHVGSTSSATRYYGDLSGPYNLNYLQLDWAAEAHIRYRFTHRFSARADLGVYALRGDQTVTKNESNNLAFSTTNVSASMGAQWDLRSVEVLNNVFYGFGYIGITCLDPSANYQNTSYKLAPLMTEGFAYMQWVAQGGYGLGLPFVVSRQMLLRLEASYTHIFSDYVDDVSTRYVNKTNRPFIEQALSDRRSEIGLSRNPVGAQRGNPWKNDGYVKFGVQLSVKL